jgi:2-dehydro-3-deoxygalactonokinase
MTIALIGVDWGTSNLRAWAFDGEGAVIATCKQGAGISAVRDGDYAAVLRHLVDGWTDGSVPILLGGMIGSRQGWHEAPYLACPAAPSGLAARALRFDTGFGPGWIVPGVSCVDASGGHDVMRGEEVQLLGAGVRDGTVILPGTHSKWVGMEDGAICRFRTFMTGEIFALLRTHSLLGRLMEDGPGDPGAFDRGVERALADPALTALLFSVRTEGLFGHIEPHGLADYLSGLLIGAELAAADRAASTTIIGEGALVERYVRAMARAGFPPPQVVAGDEAAAAGLWRIGHDIVQGACL